MNKYYYRFNEAKEIPRERVLEWQREALAKVICGDPFFYITSGNAKVIVYAPEDLGDSVCFETDVIHGINSYTERLILNQHEYMMLLQELRSEFERISEEEEEIDE